MEGANLAPIDGAAEAVSAMRLHCAVLEGLLDELEAQALRADRQVRGLRGAGLLEEAEQLGTSELARLHLRQLQVGAEFEGHARRLLGLSRAADEALPVFFARVSTALERAARSLENVQ